MEWSKYLGELKQQSRGASVDTNSGKKGESRMRQGVRVACGDSADGRQHWDPGRQLSQGKEREILAEQGADAGRDSNQYLEKSLVCAWLGS